MTHSCDSNGNYIKSEIMKKHRGHHAEVATGVRKALALKWKSWARRRHWTFENVVRGEERCLWVLDERE